MCQEVSRCRACNDTNPTFGARKDEQSHVKNATEATYSSVKLMQPRRGRNASRSSWKKSAWRASSLWCVSIFRLQRNNLPLMAFFSSLSSLSISLFFSRFLPGKKTAYRSRYFLMRFFFFIIHLFPLGPSLCTFYAPTPVFPAFYRPFRASERTSEKLPPRVSNV